MHFQAAFLSFVLELLFLDSYYLYVCKGLVSKKTPCTIIIIIIIYCYRTTQNSREQNKQTHIHIDERTGA